MSISPFPPIVPVSKSCGRIVHQHSMYSSYNLTLSHSSSSSIIFGMPSVTGNSRPVAGHFSIPLIKWTFMRIWYNALRNCSFLIRSSVNLGGNVSIPNCDDAWTNAGQSNVGIRRLTKSMSRSVTAPAFGLSITWTSTADEISSGKPFPFASAVLFRMVLCVNSLISDDDKMAS